MAVYNDNFNAPQYLEEIEWKSSYNVGEDLIDTAHRRLFGVLRRVLTVLQAGDYDRNKNVCREAIKFLEAYTMQHFAEEEGFQRSINYGGYKMHKLLHDNLREVTIPSLKEQLVSSDYSPEAVEEFISIFTGWLTGHILVEDQAITGKISSRWNSNCCEDCINNIDDRFKEMMSSVFSAEATTANRHYAGERLNHGIFYRMTLKGKGVEHFHVTFFAEEPVIYMMAGGMLGKKVFRMEKNALLSYIQMVQSFSIRIVNMIYPELEAVIVKGAKETEENLRERFKDGYPEVSIMWRVSEGRIGLCIEKHDD